MLYLFFTTLFLLPVFLGFGKFFSIIFKLNEEAISLKLIFGILFLTIIFTVLAFFFPLNSYVEIPFVLVGIALFFYFKEFQNFSSFVLKNKHILLPIAVCILFFGSFYPFILDHFGYYVPTINWLKQIGLVKGISNLDLLLGQTSFWHILQAGFSNFSDPFLRLNSVILIVYLIYIIEKKSWIQLVFLPFLFLFSQSPSPDLPVICFSLIILNEILIGSKKTGLLFLLAVFVFAIKPTMIWLPLLSFLYSVFMVKSRFLNFISGIFILLLFFIKNSWTFGFSIFPVQIMDFYLPWKPNVEILRNSSKMAILKTYDMQFSYQQIQQFSIWESIKNWLFLNGIKGKIHLSFVGILLAFFFYALKKRSKLIWIIFISILIKSILVLLFSAQYRFFIDVFFVVFFVVFWERLSRNISMLSFSVLSILFAFVLCFPKNLQDFLPSFKMSGFMGGFQTTQLYSPSEYHWKKYRNYQVGNLKFHVVKGYPFTFDTPIPAISPVFIQEYFKAGIFPQYKSKSLSDGFVWREISKVEREQIQRILKENYWSAE